MLKTPEEKRHDEIIARLDNLATLFVQLGQAILAIQQSEPEKKE